MLDQSKLRYLKIKQVKPLTIFRFEKQWWMKSRTNKSFILIDPEATFTIKWLAMDNNHSKKVAILLN